MAAPVTAPASAPPQREPGEVSWAKVLVAHGVAWLALIVYVWTAWVVSGDFHTNTLARDQAPAWYVTMIHIWEIFALVCSVAIMWWFVVRPRIQTGRMSFDGLFYLSCLALCFQEPWINWTAPQFMYSTTAINFGSFTSHIPGWTSPNSQLVPLALWALSAYFWLVGIPGWAGSKFMQWRRRRNPSVSGLSLIASVYGVFCVFDVILESFITRTQLFNYASVVPSLTLWAGTDHQFPIYETISWAGTYTGLSCLHFFRDDKGRTLAERGIDRLKIKRDGLRTFARYLAIMGVCQVIMLVTYNIPYAYWGMHAQMAQPFVEREWRNGGVCGPKTAFDCPAPGVPIAKKDSTTNRVVEVPAR